MRTNSQEEFRVAATYSFDQGISIWWIFWNRFTKSQRICLAISTRQVEVMCRYRSCSIHVIRKRVAKGKAELESHRDSDEPTTDGPQARMASRAAAVEQCCKVLLQYCTLNDEDRLTSRTHRRRGNFSWSFLSSGRNASSREISLLGRRPSHSPCKLSTRSCRSMAAKTGE